MLLATGQLADLAVLSADYFAVPEDTIKGLHSVLTVLGGKVVHASHAFSPLAPPPVPVVPEWAPGAASPSGRVADLDPPSGCGCAAF